VPVADRAGLVVLTGGPGGGKSTLLAHLAGLGHAVAPEAGRAIIRDQATIGGRLRDDPVAFAEVILTWEMRAYRAAVNGDARPVFFDRGVVDVAAAYLQLGLPVPAHVCAAVSEFRYAPTVFVAPPWRKVYVPDTERHQPWEEAVRTYDACGAAYERFGYTLVDLPFAPVEDRAAFLLARL
jgi:predicted ATPase